MAEFIKNIAHSEFKERMQNLILKKELDESTIECAKDASYDDVMAKLRHNRQAIEKNMNSIDILMNKNIKMENQCGQLLQVAHYIRRKEAN